MPEVIIPPNPNFSFSDISSPTSDLLADAKGAAASSSCGSSRLERSARQVRMTEHSTEGRCEMKICSCD